MSKRTDVANFWDQAVSRFFAGEQPHLDNLGFRQWHAAYRGEGRGEVTTEAFPEPYIGPLSPERGEPRLVALGLNPGEADLDFQGRGGVFEREIIKHGSYAAWAITTPYLRDPWSSLHRHNRYHANLRTFAQRWVGEASVRSEDVLVLELYPWHSDKVTGTMRPDPELIKTFIWGPLAEIKTDVVFAFGRDWLGTAQGLHLRETYAPVHFSISTRQLRTFELPSGQRLAVVWQPGYSGPPGAEDVNVLRNALGESGKTISALPVVRPLANERQLERIKQNSPNVSRHPSPAPTLVTPNSPSRNTRFAHLHAFAEYASAGLIQEGFGRVRIPISLRFMPVRWPDGLWYREYTQQGDFHINITDNKISFRVHIDAFHGDRPRNEAALDIVRKAIEHDLLIELPAYDDLNWRAAGRGRGDNQVCAVTASGGIVRGDPRLDAEWTVATATTWLRVFRRHPVNDLHQMADRLSGNPVVDT